MDQLWGFSRKWVEQRRGNIIGEVKELRIKR